MQIKYAQKVNIKIKLKNYITLLSFMKKFFRYKKLLNRFFSPSFYLPLVVFKRETNELVLGNYDTIGQLQDNVVYFSVPIYTDL